MTHSAHLSPSCRLWDLPRRSAVRREGGFTLIELSIVLVIIGLIAGGVLIGRDLIKAAELRKLIREKESFELAMRTFQLKYNALPGDMPNATQFWGLDGGCSWSGTPTPKTETCNGNGDGLIAPLYLGPDRERLWFWQHMANAGVIPGQYANYVAGAYHGGCGNIGISIPKASWSERAGWEWINPNRGGGSPDATGYYDRSLFLRNMVKLATCAHTPGDTLEGGAIAPQDAHSIDLKIDNGIPATGRVIGQASLCTNGDRESAIYLNIATQTCIMFFPLD